MTQPGKIDCVFAPFTQDQMDSLNGFQNSGYHHPFTCSCGKSDLVAVIGGWHCPKCNEIVQDWAFPFMTDWTWKQNPLSNIEKEKLIKIRKVMDATGFIKSFSNILEDFAESHFLNEPGLEEPKAKTLDATLKIAIPMYEMVYHKYFTNDELDSFIEFLETPMGREIGNKNADFVTEVNSVAGKILTSIHNGINQAIEDSLLAKTIAEQAHPVN